MSQEGDEEAAGSSGRLFSILIPLQEAGLWLLLPSATAVPPRQGTVPGPACLAWVIPDCPQSKLRLAEQQEELNNKSQGVLSIRISNPRASVFPWSPGAGPGSALPMW